MQNEVALTLQGLQERFGYVVMGGARGHSYQLGQVLDGWAEADGKQGGPMVVIGFTTGDEWLQQMRHSGFEPDPRLLATYDTFLKLRAE